MRECMSYAILPDAPKSVLQEAKETEGLDDSKVKIHEDLTKFMQSFKKDSPRVIIMSLPHGKPIDNVIEQLEPHLTEGDICIDGANEHYQATERRQERMKKKGVAWIGMGVSGGYQASRRGPSMSPGGDKEAYEKVKPLLREWAAKDKQGRPAVEWVGPHGAGHYVKMLHNGIEQGELSVLAEAYTLLRHTLNIPNNEIKRIFAKWNESGELSDNFLVELGSLIVGFTEGDGLQDKAGIVDDIDDKVTQDIDNSEGTGVWTVRGQLETRLRPNNRNSSLPALDLGEQGRARQDPQDAAGSSGRRAPERQGQRAPHRADPTCSVRLFLVFIRTRSQCEALLFDHRFFPVPDS